MIDVAIPHRSRYMLRSAIEIRYLSKGVEYDIFDSQVIYATLLFVDVASTILIRYPECDQIASDTGGDPGLRLRSTESAPPEVI